MKRVLVFTGAGVSAESGVETFRTDDGLWYNHKVEEVATLDGWRKDKQKVLDFYNDRRKQLKNVEPNLAHEIIASLESDFDVSVITQNVDDLHERAGSSYVIHLHGELLKSRSTVNNQLVYDCDGDINIGDKCEKGSQLRPHITFFNEKLDVMNSKLAFLNAQKADVCIVVGTSMQVAPANTIPFSTKPDCLIYYIDPGNFDFGITEGRLPYFKHIKEKATIGMDLVKQELLNLFNNEG